MLKIFQLIALFSVAVFLISIACWVVVYSTKPPHKPTQQNTSAEKPNPEQETEECETFWQRLISDPIASLTLFLVVATFLLAISSFFQLILMNRAEHIAKKTAEAAKTSAEVAEKSLALIDRPWIKVDLTIAGPLQFIKFGEKTLIAMAIKVSDEIPPNELKITRYGLAGRQAN